MPVATAKPTVPPHAYGLDAAGLALVERAARIAREVAAPHAAEVDAKPRFPTEALDALAKAGFWGLCVPTASGGARHVVPDVTADVEEPVVEPVPDRDAPDVLLALDPEEARRLDEVGLAGLRCVEEQTLDVRREALGALPDAGEPCDVVADHRVVAGPSLGGELGHRGEEGLPVAHVGAG